MFEASQVRRVDTIQSALCVTTDIVCLNHNKPISYI